MSKCLPFALCALLLLAGCRVEDTKPVYKNDSRLRAVMEAERKRAAAQAKAAQPPPAANPAPEATPPPRPVGAPGGGGARKPAGYLPPSEQGAHVEMSETPAGAPPPPPAPKASSASSAARAQGTAAGPGSAGSGPSRGGDAGGNVPHGVAPTAREGMGGGMPPGAAGRLGNSGAPAPGPGVSAPPGLQMGDPAATDAALLKSRQAFEREMQQGTAGQPGGRDQTNEGETRSGGFGGSGARPGGTGLGASPDMSGELRRNPAAYTPSESVDVEGQARDEASAAAGKPVARQLLEAARRETDPVLKQKLMDEYHKYIAP